MRLTLNLMRKQNLEIEEKFFLAKLYCAWVLLNSAYQLCILYCWQSTMFLNLKYNRCCYLIIYFLYKHSAKSVY